MIRVVLLVAVAGLLTQARVHAPPAEAENRAPIEQLRAVLLPVDAVTIDALAVERERGANAIVLDLADAGSRSFTDAVTTIRRTGLAIHYWYEVGRDPVLARAHPQWLHRPHKTQFYREPVVIDGWVCINNAEVFRAKLTDLRARLQRVGTVGVDGIFLNDVLGAPEGCGCGNALCRLWDNSLGEKISGGSGPGAFGENPIAPRLFAEHVARLAGIPATPVITEECEAGITVSGVDDPEVTLGYGRMSCRNPCAIDHYERLIDELAPLPAVGLLGFYRTLGRDAPEYGPEASWVGGIVERYLGHAPDARLIAVLEGWDVGAGEIDAQIGHALAAGATGFLVVKKPMEQTWQVRPIRARGRRI